MGKLSLKRTPAEQAERDWRKAQKAARKATRKLARQSSRSTSPLPQAPSTSNSGHDYEFEFEIDPPPRTVSPKSPASTSGAASSRLGSEEDRWNDKLFEALDGDIDVSARLDSISSRFYQYHEPEPPSSRIPKRWRYENDVQNVDPSQMQEEEYTEWVREGMWRKKHAREHAERQAAEAARAERQAATRAREKEFNEQRRREREAALLKIEKSRRVERVNARVAYEQRWVRLLSDVSSTTQQKLTWDDIPWPVFTLLVQEGNGSVLDNLTTAHIEEFVFQPLPSPDSQKVPSTLDASGRKAALRSSILRWHPDKFSSRVLGRVADEAERTAIADGAAKVVLVLGKLMENLNVT